MPTTTMATTAPAIPEFRSALRTPARHVPGGRFRMLLGSGPKPEASGSFPFLHLELDTEKGEVMRQHLLSRALLACSIAMPVFVSHAGTRIDLSVGANYSSGDYNDTTSTEVWSVPFAAKIRSDAWTFRVSVPYLQVDGPADATIVLDDNGGSRGGDSGGSGRDHPEDNTGSGGNARRRVAGLGDTTVSATYAFDRIGGSAAYVDIGGRVRLPTGDDKRGLGVGVADYGLTTEIGIDKARGGAYVTAGRRFLGHVAGIDRQDGWQAGVGGWLNASERTTLGLGYDWRESSIAGGTDPAEIYASLALKLSDRWRLSFSANKGLNRAAADFGGGVTLAWRATDR